MTSNRGVIPTSKSRSAQNGSILFLILLAIILFAALGYALTQQRDGGKDASPESMKAKASELVQYLSSIRNAVGRMIIVNGCADTQISFDYNNGASACLTSETPATGWENPNSPTDCRCHVFHPLGGGIPWRPLASMTYYSLGTNAIQYFSGTSAMPFLKNNNSSELYYGAGIYFPTGTPPAAATAFCNAYNEVVGANGFVVSSSNWYWGANGTAFTGTYADAGPMVSAFNNMPAVCYYYQGNDRYVLYYVLWER